MFKLIKNSKISQARLGRLKTEKGVIQTPFFMPIATKGVIKGLTSDEMKKINAQIILSNTYHLYLQPGMEVIKKFKGLHNFMHWDGPILTDSGGYQVFSLKNKDCHPERSEGSRQLPNDLVKITSRGVKFKSFLDGSEHLFTPERVQQIQDQIGSDIKMVLDVCSPHPCSRAQAERDLEMTHLWAEKSLSYHNKNKKICNSQFIIRNLLFAIVQGSTFKGLRLKSVRFLRELDFDGLAIGGLAVGESADKMYKVLDYTLPEMPTDKPRYLMGVGRPENIVQAVRRGVDMFDCVIPTREARHGRLYIKTQKSINKTQGFYKIINITNAKFKNSTRKLDENCSCESCQNYTLGYLRHLFKSGEPLAIRLASLHNLKFYLDLMQQIRMQIKQGRL